MGRCRGSLLARTGYVQNAKGAWVPPSELRSPITGSGWGIFNRYMGIFSRSGIGHRPIGIAGLIGGGPRLPFLREANHHYL